MNGAYGVLAAASGALDETTVAAVQNGMDTMVATVKQVVPISVLAAVTVIALTAGVNYALKKVKGIMNQAS